MKVVEVELAEIKRHPRNYRKHPPEQVAYIRASLRANGYYRPFVLAKDGTLLAGHGLLDAALAEKKKKGPAVKLRLDPFSPAALKIVAGDNEIGRGADVDDRALSEILAEIRETEGLEGTGFDDAQLAALVFVTRPEGEIKDLDAAAAWVGMPDYEPSKKPIRIVVSFEGETARDAFMQKIGAKIVNKKVGDCWAIWWPERAREDLASLRFEAKDAT